MLNRIGHISITVTDLDKSIKFYEDILGMKLAKQMVMDCKTTEVLFGISACRVKVAHLRGCVDCGSPIIELMQFKSEDTLKDDVRLNRVSVSKVSFTVDDINQTYKELKDKGVEFVSSPQSFEYTEQGFGKNKSVFFKDPDGVILELQEIVEEGTPVDELDINTCVSPSEESVTIV